MKLGVLLLLPLMFTAAVFGDNADQCRTSQHHGKTEAAHACFLNLTKSADFLLRGEGYLGLQQYDAANDALRQADKRQPNSAVVKTVWGQVFAEHSQPGDAGKLFEEAIESDSNYAPAYLGLARVLAESYDKNAVELAQKALQHDPKLTEAHEFLAYLALEDSDEKLAAEEANKALALSDEALDGMAILASIDWLDGKGDTGWISRVLKVNPVYGEAYATGAHFFVINRRYDEGIRLYRRALELNSHFWSARSQLGINLMRIGQEDSAKQELEKCFNAHFRDAQTVNALRLLDTLNDYQTFKTPSTELFLNKKEALLLQPYIGPELQRAISTYERKYKMKLPGPVRLEVFPNHEDFVVRTLGLPGQGGLLGVTFGTVVAMDSPSARAAGDFNWASTMWHELSHVYVVTATHHLVPRWFTEGVAVHEEGAASPDWGNRITPDIMAAVEKKKLLPVLELDRGFVRPDYPNQVLVSYYQAGKLCDYIVHRWGDDAILGMIHSYASRKTTAESIQDNLHVTPEALDKDFFKWLEKEKGDPNAKSSYERDAEAALSAGNKNAAEQTLVKYRDYGATNIQLMKTLAEMEKQFGKPAQAITTLEKLNYIYPEDEQVHQRLGTLLFDSGHVDLAVREYRAVIALQPDDVAESHFNLARALKAAHQTAEAKDQVLSALEVAPGYKPAQQLLLELTR